MGKTAEVIGTRDNEDLLGPVERRKAAARILARGIRRLLTRPPAISAAPVPESEMNSAAVLTGKPESAALPVPERRALMARERAG